MYDTKGVHFFILKNGSLMPEKTPETYYITAFGGNGNTQNFNWEKIPIIPIKYNEREIPLIKKVKSLQDDINVTLSDFENNMQQDARNTILVLKNYGSTNLGEFRRNLTTYGAVKCAVKVSVTTVLRRLK